MYKISQAINNLILTIKKQPFHILILLLGVLILIQQERIIHAVREAGYYEPRELDVNVVNTPDVNVLH